MSQRDYMPAYSATKVVVRTNGITKWDPECIWVYEVGTHLIFGESDSGSAKDSQKMSGVHNQVYKSDFIVYT